ncbi:MAG TPA: 1,4-alpha-glucan branching protein GlgB [Streptosporangiaceae bacterium]|jgi:1,4-alpha-glucan branching enzyme
MTTISTGELDRVLAGTHHDPHAVLGAHPGPDGITVRTLKPLATSVTVLLADGRRFGMEHVHGGVFACLLPADVAGAPGQVPDYRLAVSYTDSAANSAAAGAADHGTETIMDDPYRHQPTVGEMDLYLIGEGRHEELWRVLGSHLRVYSGSGQGRRQPFIEIFAVTAGASFAVWAPNARGVRVIGDFNHWDGRGHPMRSLGGAGVWELFIPGIGEGTRYKYEICGPDGTWRAKADPMARLAEPPPATASVVTQTHHEWADGAWMAGRGARNPVASPMSVYEVHIGSWRKGLSYRQLADQLTAYVTEMGFSHVEFLPVAEHPFGGSWGYQVTSYYAPSARFGSPDDFRYLVDRLHQAGIGVLVDWVPAHFPRDDWALAGFDGTPLYEHPDPRRGAQPDWGTLIFNYGRNEVRNFLVANAVYWLEEFHIDGLRVDAVASMLYLDYSRQPGEWAPNAMGGNENLEAVAFLQEVNTVCYRRAPGIAMVAEESTAWPGVTRPVHLGGLGFGLKWNMGWMHDTLAYLARDPIFRHYHHNELTFSLVYAFSENFVLPLSHDEVVHGKGSLLGKMPGDDWRRFAQLRALLAYMWAHPGKQLLFMGSEFGQGAEWSADRGLDWWVLDDDYHAGVQRLVKDLNAAYSSAPALWQADSSPAGFSWIDANDAAGNTLSFLRLPEPGSAAPALACVANFSGEPHLDYRLGLPRTGRWREVVNTDAGIYGGSGVGNLGGVEAVDEPWHGRPASATIAVPPLGVVWLMAEPGGGPEPGG